MSDVGEVFKALKDYRREMRAKHGVECPQCKVNRPRANATILLPQQRCRVGGYRDTRPGLVNEVTDSE